MREPVPFVSRAFQDFLTIPLDQRLTLRTPEEAARRALALFHHVYRTVPAYRTFLAQNGVAAADIHTVTDFKRIPPATKENYVLQYPLPHLCRNGKLEECDMVAISSGSTGKPTYWPRFLIDELGIATRFEQIFRDSFHADTHSALAVVCFAMGTWVGGMYTAACCRHLAARGYPVTVITPGTNREEILRAVQELGPHFEQVVLLGYPPFLKGLVDQGHAAGLDWKKYNVKLVMAGEVITEEWRTLMAERLGSADIVRDFASMYGTADAGVLGVETPISIFIRRWLAENPNAAHTLFGESRLPTLVQYDPYSRYFEAVDGKLLITGDNGVPLIRYNILDRGGLIPFDTLMQFLRTHAFEPVTLMGRTARGVRPLPFLYLFGRADYTVSYYGANIYPENVMVGLDQPDIRDWVTGRFVMEIQSDSDVNRRLGVYVELTPGMEGDDAKRDAIEVSIRMQLLRLNSEYANYVPEEVRPLLITLCAANDPAHFASTGKHSYTRRTKLAEPELPIF